MTAGPRNNYLPIDPNARRVRVELNDEVIGGLAKLGVPHRLTVSAVCRCALTLLSRGEAVTPEAVYAEAERVRTTAGPGAAASAPATPARPRKAPPAEKPNRTRRKPT